MTHELFRRAGFILAYLGLAFIVTFGTFWIRHQFRDAHNERCSLAQAQVEVATAIYVAFREVPGTNPGDPQVVNLINEATEKINDTCGLHLQPLNLPSSP